MGVPSITGVGVVVGVDVEVGVYVEVSVGTSVAEGEWLVLEMGVPGLLLHPEINIASRIRLQKILQFESRKCCLIGSSKTRKFHLWITNKIQCFRLYV
jgi:hypothetical protein